MTSSTTDDTASSSLAFETASLFCPFCFENLDGDCAHLGDCLDPELSLVVPPSPPPPLLIGLEELLGTSWIPSKTSCVQPHCGFPVGCHIRAHCISAGNSFHSYPYGLGTICAAPGLLCCNLSPWDMPCSCLSCCSPLSPRLLRPPVSLT